MTKFMTEDFLLDTETARNLYHNVAASLPIIDYHSHLSPQDILNRKKFRNIATLWLGEGNAGDHYKWRLMRSMGVAEDYITGNKPDEERFRAFCKVLPYAIGSPIYHWSHLELRRLFDIDLLINEKNAGRLWEEVNAKLADKDCWSFLEQAKVEIACTTDDPADDLVAHQQIAKSALKTRVLPAYRPDKAMRINQEGFVDYLNKLGQCTATSIKSYADMIAALANRVEFFHQQGARISDHAVDTALPAEAATPQQIEALFQKRLQGGVLSESELGAYLRAILTDLGRVYAKYNWTMCLHIGAQRNNNSRMMAKLGPDTGYDSISDMSCSAGLAALLDTLDRDEQLPKTMLFCLNENMNDILSTMLGNFQDGITAGKLQFGPAWWFNDHKDGNLQQFRTLGNHGVLGTSVGMVTDSRSFAAYPRHEYYRRLLCKLLGQWVEAGEYPAEEEALAQIVRNVSYENAKQYFGM